MERAKNKPQRNSGRKPLVFVVDDEPVLLELAATVLGTMYEIRTFNRPEVALEAYRDANPRPDLIITDYAMHNMNGMDLIRDCRKINPSQKIILLSGTVDEDIYSKSDVRPDRFLAKPYSTQQLIALVQSVLAG